VLFRLNKIKTFNVKNNQNKQKETHMRIIA